MNTLQVISCDQQFPAHLSHSWSQGAVIEYQGDQRILLCGGAYMTGCFYWTDEGWLAMDTTYFNKRYQGGFKYYIVIIGANNIEMLTR